MKLMDHLTRAVEDGASDLFLIAGSPISEKINRHLRPLTEEKALPRDTEALIGELYKLAKRPIENFLLCGDDDFSFSLPGLSRFRVNAYQQRGSLAAVVRIVAFGIPDWRELGIPEPIIRLGEESHGMVLVTGSAGSGKSTTQACIIDHINHTQARHIVTLESPIAYLHRNLRSIVSQREIAIDTPDYRSALRACLRQAPDVILLGEMRDAETICAAMAAAETGCLLIATLHTRGAVSAIRRIVDSFPGEQQGQVRVQLSLALRAVVSQQLLPDVNGGLVPAFEVMHMNSAIRSLVRSGEFHRIDNLIEAGGAEQMFTMDQSILSLYRAGRISKGTALDSAENPGQLKSRLGLV